LNDRIVERPKQARGGGYLGKNGKGLRVEGKKETEEGQVRNHESNSSRTVRVTI